ncbi:MAG: hypothetical protein ACXVA7_22890, partial [Isosphaeraceae bacterium]
MTWHYDWGFGAIPGPSAKELRQKPRRNCRRKVMRGRGPAKLAIARRDQNALHFAAHSSSLPWFQVQRARIVLAIA